MTSAHLYEIQVGIFATPGGVEKVAEGFEHLLRQRAVPYVLTVLDQDQRTRDGEMKLSEFYDELPPHWTDLRGGADPGDRRVHEFRIGVLLPSREQMDALRSALTSTLCPDPDHDGACPIPWSSGFVDGQGGVYRENERYLNRQYAPLRGRA
ncbi:hypothetical protein GCM10009654_16320 [Streptomyces hebeiensis]|uniref:Uncharacterized protein n=1 Tax=Streptomyces hebeiensis TaxID=229486 RepID=A0ABP4F876_9ACTN